MGAPPQAVLGHDEGISTSRQPVAGQQLAESDAAVPPDARHGQRAAAPHAQVDVGEGEQTVLFQGHSVHK